MCHLSSQPVGRRCQQRQSGRGAVIGKLVVVVLVDNDNKDFHLERVESSQEKVFIIFLLVLEHVVVVGVVVVVVVHRAVGVDQEQGGGRGGGEGDGGRPG